MTKLNQNYPGKSTYLRVLPKRQTRENSSSYPRGNIFEDSPAARISLVPGSRSRPFLHAHILSWPSCRNVTWAVCTRVPSTVVEYLLLWLGIDLLPTCLRSSGTSLGLAIHIYRQDTCWIYMTVRSWPSRRADQRKRKQKDTLDDDAAENQCKQRGRLPGPNEILLGLGW